MSRWERFFLVVQRVSNVLVILFAGFVLTMTAWQWLESYEFRNEEARYERQFGGKFERTLPYSGQEIETAGGSLIAVFQEDENTLQRVELGGLTITNPSTGKFIEVAPGGAANVVQFELVFDRGDDGKVVGYVATIATPEQYEQGRQDLVVGGLPALTRHVVARNIRASDLPRVRGDGSVGILMWPEEGEAHLVAIRLGDGAIIERTKVKLPTLKEEKLSQGPGSGHFALGRQGIPAEAPQFTYLE